MKSKRVLTYLRRKRPVVVILVVKHLRVTMCYEDVGILMAHRQPLKVGTQWVPSGWLSIYFAPTDRHK